MILKIVPIFILLGLPLFKSQVLEGRNRGSSTTSRGQDNSIPGINSVSAANNNVGGGSSVDVSSVNICRRCEYLGVTYQGNSPATFERGCWQYNCFCYCDGRFDCPSNRSRYLCSGPEQCVQCDVTQYNGTYEQPNTKFQLRRGCELYDNCRCDCDGSWSCDEGIYTCPLETGCLVDGDRYAAGQTFELTRGCYKYTECICKPSSEWRCNKTTDICGQCRQCQIGENFYDGGTEGFPATSNCTTYRSCSCKCDGTFECQGGINVCQGENLIDRNCPDCIIDGVTYRNGQSFDYEATCLNHTHCECRCGTTACREVTNTCGDCRSCNVDGKNYAAGTTFSHKQGCYDYKRCECNCDGRWECFGDDAVDTCNTCKKCSADGQTYDAYSKLEIKRGCWQYQCFCLCNGTTWCPSVTAINTCTQPQRCLTCDVKGQIYTGNKLFKYQHDGMDLYCRCNCDGSYVCVAEWLFVRASVSISGNGGYGGSGCFSCLMDGVSYSGDTRYRIDRSGLSLNCECHCDGSFACYGQKNSEYQGCLGCTVGGASYAGNSNFTTVYNGTKLNCQCSCDGGYICQGAYQEMSSFSLEAYMQAYLDYLRSLFIQCRNAGMAGCLPISSSQCMVNGLIHPAGMNFIYQFNKANVDCLCGIDGSYFCEGMSGRMWLSCVGGACTEIGCKQCLIDGRSYGHGSQFAYRFNGIDLRCSCNCDGLAYCIGVQRSINVTCIDNSCTQTGCSSCRYCDQSYQGGSSFNLIHQGLRMDCACSCDTSYRCESVVSRDVFECDAGNTCGPKRCKKCRVDGKRYRGRSTFSWNYSGTSVSCTCGCDGSYYCQSTIEEIEISCPKRRTCRPVRGCLSCMINGVRYDGGSEYEINKNNGRHRCQCGCDGRSQCKLIEPSCTSCTIDGDIYRGGSTNRVFRNSVSHICYCECSGTHRCELEFQCQQCNIAGVAYRSDTSFREVIEGVTMDCTCDCEGNYECRSTYKICVPSGCRSLCQQCLIDGQTFTDYSGNTFDAFVFGLDMQCRCDCDGSYHCTCPTRTCSSTSGCVNNCQQCVIDNRLFEESADFQAEVFGHRMRCSCECNGRYRCMNEIVTCTSTSGCVDNCRNCVIDNQQFRRSSNFHADVFGYRMQCSCECDGSYRCTGEWQTCTQAGCVDNCRHCQIDGRNFRRNSNFRADVFGDDMQCSCECNGSYRCTSQTQTCTVSGCVSNCQHCLIDNQSFTRNNNFQADVFGYRMECSCECDGSYRCTSEWQTCTMSGCVDNCRHCLIDGQNFRRNSNFRADVFGYNMQCSCECNGSYRCQSETKICTSSGCRDNCRQCNIDGQSFRRNSNFQANVFGHRMRCSCDCSGSYRCTSETQTCTSTGCVDNCNQCLIDGQRFTRNSNFQADVFGYRMQCSCDCTGSYRCVSETRVCESTSGCVERCQSCYINEVSYNGNSNFNAQLQGIRMKCRCDCNGNYECQGDNYMCRPTGCEITNRCVGCMIEGKSYQGNSKFTVFYNAYGIDMRCECRCGGSYTCRGTKEVSTCRDNSCSRNDCHSCSISGIEYRGGSTFNTMIDGNSMDCRCACNGGYRCTGSRDQRVDIQDDSIRRTVVAIRPSGYGNSREYRKSRRYKNAYTSRTYKTKSDRSEVTSSVNSMSLTSRMMADGTSPGIRKGVSIKYYLVNIVSML
ncbi:hypothetical protein ACF0H5_024207 [Mactra antiquata]